MTIKIIQEKLNGYQCSSWQEEEIALKEIFQEIALAALGRRDFFKQAIFQGGTALRILYSLERFSEDLDFCLKKPDKNFDLLSYVKNCEEEFRVFGISMTTEDRTKTDDTVKKAFLKEDSLGTVLILQHKPRDQRPKKVRIKLEIDTHPPDGSQFETKYLDFPYPSAVTVQDPPSLFAGKSNALFCREYTKGRDWYDFLWYVARKTPLNYQLLSGGLNQQGPWRGKNIVVTKEWYLEEMKKKVHTTNWDEAKDDVARFLKSKDLETLKFWNQDFFSDRIRKLEEYL